MDIFNPQFVSQFAKLDSIQSMMLILLVLIGGLLVVNIRQQGVTKQSSEASNKTTMQLLDTMQTQSTQSNARETVLAEANKLQAEATDKVARVLMLIHKEQKRHSTAQDDTQKLIQQLHDKEMAKFDEVLTELRIVKTTVDQQPVVNIEIKSRLDRMLGHLEMLLPRIRITSEVPKATDTAIPSPP